MGSKKILGKKLHEIFALTGNMKLKGGLRITLKFTINQGMISDFIQTLKDQIREEYWRSPYAIYCLSMVDFQESANQ